MGTDAWAPPRVVKITLSEWEYLEAMRDVEYRAQLELDLVEAQEQIAFLEALLGDVLREARPVRRLVAA